MRTSEHEVIIADGGPPGLMLAAELALAGVDVAIVERRPTQDRVGGRAVALPPAVLIWPDGRMAWTGNGDGLADALATWCGRPAPPT
jgi:3-(3-hydroxy-phenyl)propionate hydroxylase